LTNTYPRQLIFFFAKVLGGEFELQRYLARALLGMDPNYAVEILEQVYEMHPDNSQTQYILASSYSRLVDPDRAILRCKRLVEQCPSNYDVVNVFETIVHRLENPIQGFKIWKTLAERYPTQIAFQHFNGTCVDKLDEYWSEESLSKAFEFEVGSHESRMLWQQLLQQPLGIGVQTMVERVLEADGDTTKSIMVWSALAGKYPELLSHLKRVMVSIDQANRVAIPKLSRRTPRQLAVAFSFGASVRRPYTIKSTAGGRRTESYLRCSGESGGRACLHDL
jgi:tetratricopeptide (TPR) repeat protein